MRLAVLGLVSGIAAAQTSIDFTGRYWAPASSVRIRVEAGGFGTDIDGGRDLGFTDTGFPEGVVSLAHGRQRLTFTYTPIEYSADQNVNRTISFRGRQYTIGTRVVSDLEVRHLQLTWTWQFIHAENDKFRLGPVIETDGFLMHGALAAPNLGFSEQEDLSIGLPTVGLALDLKPHRRIDIYGQVAGMKIGGYGYFVGSDSGIKIYAWRHLLFTAGYRTFNLHVDHAPDFARLQLRGPFAGAGFRF
jgi:hypothetical protein